MYTTTAFHVEEGQERFVIEFDTESESVRYLIEAISRPRHILARIGYPYLARDAASIRKRFTRTDETLCPRSLIRRAECQAHEMPYHDAGSGNSQDQRHTGFPDTTGILYRRDQVCSDDCDTAASTASMRASLKPQGRRNKKHVRAPAPTPGHWQRVR